MRQAILRAAAGVFRRRGFAGTGMRDIARAADLSPGILYYYFRSKEELLYFCQEHSLERMLASAREAPARGGPAERLGRVIRAHLACMLDELDGAAAHTEVDALPPPLRQRIVARRDAYERAVRRIVADGVRRRAFVPCDPALVTRALLGALNWTAKWYRPEGAVPPAAVADAYAAYLIRGLLR